MTVVSESGLYSLILKSGKPQAPGLKKWVTRTVLPSILTHGLPKEEVTTVATKNVTNFNFNGKDIRILADNPDEPMFVASDVAKVLGYRFPKDAISTHCKGATKRRLLTAGGKQFVTIIPERDVYRLIMRSKLPQAEAFEEWVVGEVLPSIRKHGGYVQGQENDDDPQMLMAKALKVADSVIAEKDKKLEQQREMLEEDPWPLHTCACSTKLLHLFLG